MNPLPSFRSSLLVPATTLLLSLVPALSGQEAAVRQAREVYAEVNEAAKSYQLTSKSSEDADGYPLDVKAWKDRQGTVRKLESVRSEDHGSETTEFYYAADGTLVFAYQMVTTENISTGKIVNRAEHRYYFDAGTGALVQWLDPEKNPVRPDDPSFAPQADLVRSVEAQSRALVAAGSAAPREKILGEGKTTGVFRGIEQGDYFYLRLGVAKDEEQSFMILRSEGFLREVTENPDRYLGQKLTAHWQEKVIFIPEAGGDQQVTVCVQVERP
jgi:hypothetical protein